MAGAFQSGAFQFGAYQQGAGAPATLGRSGLGGDDIPYRKSPHLGWDKKRAKLKLNREREFEADIRAIYRELTGHAPTAAQAEAIIEQVAAARKLDRETALRELVRAAERAQPEAINAEIALRLLYRQWNDWQRAQDAADEQDLMQFLPYLM